MFPSAVEYEHINLNQIDDGFKPVDERVYTLEVNKLEPTDIEIKKAGHALFGQKVLVLKGSFTIVDDEQFSGRKLWKDFWTYQPFDQRSLKKLMVSTGVSQGNDESLRDWAGQFGLLNPPARFQTIVQQKPDYRDPEGPAVNEINFRQAKPV